MSPGATTRALVVAVLLLAAADAGLRLSRRASTPAPLPTIAGFLPEQVDRIELGRADERRVLERDGDRWWLLGPPRVPADPEEVRTLLGVLGDGLHPEARVGDGEGERYGLDGGAELPVRVSAGGAPLLSMVVGAAADPETAFVRLPGDDAVYRVQVPRERLARTAAGWRDRALWRRDVERVRLEGPSGSLELARGPGGWAPADGAPVDPRAAEALVRFAATPRVEGWLDAATDAPTHRLVVDGPDGAAVLEFGVLDADRAWVRDASDPTRVGWAPGGILRIFTPIVGG